MGCPEPQPRRRCQGWGSAQGWRGLVWCTSGLPAGISSCWGVCCWWAGGPRGCHGVVTSGAKHGGTQGDTLRCFVQVGGRGGTGKNGFSLTGGEVVGGSDRVRPTTFEQVNCSF